MFLSILKQGLVYCPFEGRACLSKTAALYYGLLVTPGIIRLKTYYNVIAILKRNTIK